MTYPHAIVIVAAVVAAAVYFDKNADAQATGAWVSITASQGQQGGSVAWAVHSTGSVKRCAPEPDGLFCREAPFKGDR